MSFPFRTYRTGLLEGDFDHVTDSVRAILVMQGSGALTDTGQTFVSDIVGLAEYDGANYSRQVLASKAVADLVTYARFTAASWSIAALGAGSLPAVGILFIKHVTNDADSRVMFLGTIPPFNGTGIAVPFQPDPTLGLVYMT